MYLRKLLTNRFLIRLLYISLFHGFFYTQAIAQPVAIGSLLDQSIRSLQLLGKFDSSVSLTVRPVIAAQNNSYLQLLSMIDPTDRVTYGKPVSFLNKKASLIVLPVSIVQQYNTHHPYGWNDGAMIAAKGYQALISAGIYVAAGPLEIKLQPEWVYAANPAYETNINYGSNSSKSYHKIFAGQSSIRLSAGVISVGVSTENLWWGPGIHSSLLMSNNAPGFTHAFFASKKPWRTGIGNFEWQLIGAKLTSDNSKAYENYNIKPAALPDNWRYLNAYVISYQPKWTPGLFLGMTRGLQRYKKDVDLSTGSIVNKYFPVVFKAFQKQNAQGDDTLRTDQVASFFIRWVLPKAHAEFYIEYGYNDYNQNIRDYLTSPTHSAAHIIGVKKLFPLKSASYLDMGFEITQMSPTPDQIVRDAGNWYTHGDILQGYTHNNEIIGAGAGLGCNVVSITGKWVNKWEQLGILIERVERNPFFNTNKWVDLSIGLMPQYKYRGMVFSGVFQFVKSQNYAWDKGVDRFNLHTRLGVQYLF